MTPAPSTRQPTLPRAGAMWPPPPEVVTDYHRHQVLALTDSGEPFTQYVECSDGCGYVIGCGDAVESASHMSCAERTAHKAEAAAS